jgi:hypothetical protein
MDSPDPSAEVFGYLFPRIETAAVPGAVVTGGRDHDTKCQPCAEYVGRGLDRGDISHCPGNQFHPVERLAVAPQDKFAFGSERGVLISVLGQPGIERRLRNRMRSPTRPFSECGCDPGK